MKREIEHTLEFYTKDHEFIGLFIIEKDFKHEDNNKTANFVFFTKEKELLTTKKFDYVVHKTSWKSGCNVWFDNSEMFTKDPSSIEETKIFNPEVSIKNKKINISSPLWVKYIAGTSCT
jgi:hypothetical protein